MAQQCQLVNSKAQFTHFIQPFTPPLLLLHQKHYLTLAIFLQLVVLLIKLIQESNQHFSHSILILPHLQLVHAKLFIPLVK